MKITYLYQYFGTPKGSWSTRAYEMTKKWVEQGHEVTVITAPYDKSDIKPDGLISYQLVDGIKLIVINSGDSNRFSKLKRVTRALKFSFLASYYSLKTSSDIIIASSGPITIGIPGLISKWIKGKPLVFEVRDLWPDGGIEMGLIKGKVIIKLSKWFEGLCYKNSSLIVPCSIGMEASILKRYPKANTLVITNASDVALFEKTSTPNFKFPNWVKEECSCLIYTGSLGFMDACMEIIEGFNLLVDKEEVHIVFIGDGSERLIMEQRVDALNLISNIHFTGLIPKNEVVEWYKIAKASFVLFKDFPVLSTSSPNKMFDSFAAGVPIIQNTNGWIKELVNKNQCGLNVNANDPISMAKAIEFFSSQTAIEMGENSKKLANYDFNRELLALKFLNSLKTISEAK